MGEWVLGTTIEDLIRDYHRDPFPHSLLRTREITAEAFTATFELRI